MVSVRSLVVEFTDPVLYDPVLGPLGWLVMVVALVSLFQCPIVMLLEFSLDGSCHNQSWDAIYCFPFLYIMCFLLVVSLGRDLVTFGRVFLEQDFIADADLLFLYAFCHSLASLSA